MKSKYLKLLLFILVLGGLFFAVYRFGNKPATIVPEKNKEPMKVTVQSASASNNLTREIAFPASVTGEQEVKVTAEASGTAQQVNYDLGDKVSTNTVLAKIADSENEQQSQLSVEQVQEQLKAARKSYKELDRAYKAQKKDTVKTITRAQVIAANGQVEVLEVQLKNAQVGLNEDTDNRTVNSPISGYVVSRSISDGDSVSMGQQLFTISQTKDLKIQFYVDQDQLSDVKEGMDVNVEDNSGNKYSAKVKNISPDADTATRRFLVEADPNQQLTQVLNSGIVLTISFPLTEEPKDNGDLILPLTALTIGQNESHIFLAENGKAKKVSVLVVNVTGSAAEVKADIPSNSMIIIDGSKLVQDGDSVTISQ